MVRKIIGLFDRNTLVHLRLTFSFFLLPIFCFAISQASNVNFYNATIVFFVLHLFIYPASNIYNSFMDEDKGSIGGLKNPPPVTRKLYYMSIIFDSIGLILCLLVNFQFFLIILLYIFVSKVYSWKGIRLKKYSVLGWIVVILFQGGYTFMLVNMAVENDFTANWFTQKNTSCMFIATMLIGGFYPLSQIYQHKEDKERGDITISYKLGVNGTFLFSGLMFLFSFIFLWFYFKTFYNLNHFYVFAFCNIPAILFFNYWFMIIQKDKSMVNYSNTMRMTLISSICMIVCYNILWSFNFSFELV